MNSGASPGISGRLSETRRIFLNGLISVFAAITTIGIAFPLGMFLWPKEERRTAGGKRSMKLPMDDIAIGDVKFVRFLNKPTVILRPNEQEVIALSAVCTHLGCVVKWQERSKVLFCPCHGGKFDIKGRVTGGPPPKSLPFYPVKVSSGYIVIEEA